MKHNIFSFTLFILILNSVLVTSAFCENQLKEFPEYYCRLTLPDTTWKWDNRSENPNLSAIARSENGIIFLFGAKPLKDDYAICDKFIAGIEKGQLDYPDVSKTGSRKLTYCGVPCYQLETFMSDTNIHTINHKPVF